MITVAVESTATNDLNKTGLAFNIYPNPTNGICTIELSGFRDFGTGKDWVLHIEDIQGKVVEQKRVTLFSTSFLLDVSALAKGIYQVRLSNGERLGFGRFVRM